MKQYFIIVIYILFSLQLMGQESIVSDKITLKTGEIFVGKIVLKTTDLVMISTNDGTRYQFQLSEVRKIEKETNISNTEKTDSIKMNIDSGNFGSQIELNAGFSNARNCFGWSPNTQISLIFGNKNLLGKALFGGVGVGYENVFVTNSTESIQFLPLYITIQNAFNGKRTNPILGLEVGYGFALSSGYKGGALVKLTAGIAHKINNNSTIIAGVFTGIQSFTGNLTDTNNLGAYTYFGNTTMNNLGFKIGLRF